MSVVINPALKLSYAISCDTPGPFIKVTIQVFYHLHGRM